MAISARQKTFIEVLFHQLRAQRPERPPVHGVLANKLRERVERAQAAGRSTFILAHQDAAFFGSAAAEMWLRAIHSFLISNSLTRASPIWASVTGYYASHYVMRALSHLLGHFLLRRQNRVVSMTLERGVFQCDTAQRRGPKAEHQYYWTIPQIEIGEKGNVLFSDNGPQNTRKSGPEKLTDSLHRVYANYFDHINSFSAFEPVDEPFLIGRVNRLSEMVNDTPTIPDYRKFPDLDSVHIIAYARIVLFRKLLDEIVGPRHTYWRFFREPSWFHRYMNFQVPEGSTLSALSSIPDA